MGEIHTGQFQVNSMKHNNTIPELYKRSELSKMKAAKSKRTLYLCIGKAYTEFQMNSTKHGENPWKTSMWKNRHTDGQDHHIVRSAFCGRIKSKQNISTFVNFYSINFVDVTLGYDKWENILAVHARHHWCERMIRLCLIEFSVWHSFQCPRWLVKYTRWLVMVMLKFRTELHKVHTRTLNCDILN